MGHEPSLIPLLLTGGKSLDQVRANALTSLQALNQTLSVLDGVSRAIEEAKRDHKHADQIKEVRRGRECMRALVAGLSVLYEGLGSGNVTAPEKVPDGAQT